MKIEIKHCQHQAMQGETEYINRLRAATAPVRPTNSAFPETKEHSQNLLAPIDLFKFAPSLVRKSHELDPL